MTVAREGWGIIAACAAAALLVSFVSWLWALPLWLLLLFCLQFFREPQRTINTAPGTVLSAADGRVVYIGPGKSPLDGGDTLKISVFMNVFNVHSNRAPVGGRVTHCQHVAGSFFNAALDKASEQNERQLIAIDCTGRQVISVQIAGLLARRILCYAKVGDELTAGQRYGFIRFGSRVDLYLPQECLPQVRLRDKTVAGVTTLALLPPAEQGDAA